MSIELYWTAFIGLSLLAFIAGAVALVNQEEVGALGGRRVSVRLFVSMLILWIVATVASTYAGAYVSANATYDDQLLAMLWGGIFMMIAAALFMLFAARYDFGLPEKPNKTEKSDAVAARDVLSDESDSSHDESANSAKTASELRLHRA